MTGAATTKARARVAPWADWSKLKTFDLPSIDPSAYTKSCRRNCIFCGIDHAAARGYPASGDCPFIANVIVL